MSDAQVDYLHRKGHTRLAYAGTADRRHHDFCAERIRGFANACLDRDLSGSRIADFPADVGGAMRLLESWLTAPRPPTAVCAYSDPVALTVLAAARRMGRTVPDELAVIGVDDIEAAPYSQPPLTTVRLNLRQEAHRVAEAVSAALSRPPLTTAPPSSQTVTIVPRDSA